MGTGFDFINRVFTLNTTTEHLPQRIVAHEEKREIPATRFTKFKKPANGFLDNYRQQKENDSFFFTNNCAIILTHNPWLKKDIQRDFLNSEFQVDYNVHTNTVQVQPAGPVLKCIEIRCSANSLVKECTMESARVVFSKLKGFPPGIEDKLQTEEFLMAANEIVEVIRAFGTLFTPVVSDMSGNINKIRKSYEKNCVKGKYLEDLIALHGKEDNFVADALLWLKRGLQLICIFFENIYNDLEQSQAIKKHLQDAYERTLKPYHGFIVQTTVKIIYNWVPTRSQLIGQGTVHKENMEVLSTYLPTLRGHLNRLDALLKQYKLDDSK
uniref:Glycolipid transfer protein domain-containing protein n=1 Tax=Glossina brevipalpis TaxID=37001 RepID=A0A1A9W8M0_9MUSC